MSEPSSAAGALAWVVPGAAAALPLLASAVAASAAVREWRTRNAARERGEAVAVLRAVADYRRRVGDRGSATKSAGSPLDWATARRLASPLLVELLLARSARRTGRELVEAGRELGRRLAPEAARHRVASLKALGGTLVGRRTRLVHIALAGLCPDEAFLPDLVRLAGTGPSRTSQMALLAIGTSAAEYGGAWEAVATRVRKGPSAGSSLAVWTLGELCAGHPAVLLSLAGDPSHAVRRAAVRAAGALLPETNAPQQARLLLGVVLDALKDRDADVRSAGISALADVGGQAAVDEARKAMLDRSPVVAASAAVALAALDPPNGPAAAAEALEGIPAGRAPLLLAALGEARRTPIAEWLAVALEPGPARRRVAILGALGTQGTPGIAEALLPLLEDEEKAVRRSAAAAIAGAVRANGARAERPEICAALLRRFPVETSESVRAALIEAIAVTGGPTAAQDLLALMDGASPQLRTRALDALVILDLRGRRGGGTRQGADGAALERARGRRAPEQTREPNDAGSGVHSTTPTRGGEPCTS